METEVEIVRTIAEHLGLAPEELDRNANLRDDLALGSLEINDLLESLQQRFKISFEPDEVANVHTVSDLIVLVEDNLIA